MNAASGSRAPAATWLELARSAAPGPERPTGATRRELLAVALGDERYALPVERVREIVRLRPVTPMPCVPDAVLGVVALRGQMIQVIDLRARLSLPPVAPGRASRIVVVHGGQVEPAALLVDRVIGVLRIDETDLRPSPGDGGSVVAWVRSDERFVSLVDVDRVLDLGPGN